MEIALIGAELEENLAVRYLRGALEAAGHRVRQIVFNGPDELERAARDLAASRARLAGLSMVFTYRAREFARLATRARELGYPGHLVAGGHFASFHAERLLADVPALDSVGIGEGEALLCALASALGDDLAAVPGLVWRAPDGVVRNPPAAKQPDLDALPVPPRKVPFDRWLDLPITNILGSRGCKYACSFCSIAAWHRLCGGERLRLRSPERIADEMAELYRQGVVVFNFHDDNFFLPRTDETFARVRALEAALERRGIGRIAFAVKSRPDTVERELYAHLKQMGLFRLFLGIEAGSPASLKHLGRGQTLEENERALEVVNDLDLHTCFNLLLFNPESTLEDVADNVAFLRRHPRNPTNFCRTEIYAGTPLERRLREQGRLLGDYWGYGYRIADERAQLLFGVVGPAFRERNFAMQGLHHRTMALDFEHQLLGHFHGVRDELRRRVKEHIVRVNTDTCDLLDEAIEAVASGRADAGARTRYARALGERVTERGRLLAADDERLRSEILDAARAARGRSRAAPAWMRNAAAASFAVTVAATPACTKPATPETHATETIAAPLEGGAPEADAQAADNTADAAAPDGGASDAGPTDAGAGDAGDAGAADAGARDAGVVDAGAKPKPRPAPRPGPHHTEMAPMWFMPPDDDGKV